MLSKDIPCAGVTNNAADLQVSNFSNKRSNTGVFIGILRNI